MKTEHATRILVATDFSRASTAAVRTALRMARERGGELVVVHVLETPAPLAEGYIVPRIYDEIARAVRQDATRRMRRLLAVASRAGVPARGLLLRGAPHEAIARAARTHGVDQVVVGTHGRTGFSRLVLGSVAARVIAASSRPTLVVPSSSRSRRRAA
jgi:nucleotide-binding universal stress UspA family protein